MVATPQEQALLDTIRYAEGTWRNGSPEGYRVVFGGGLTNSLEKHPDKVIRSGGYASAASGAYQFMPFTWAPLQKELGLPDFGPRSQDRAALALVERRGARELINSRGLTPEVAAKLAPEWASFPTLAGKSYYGQPVKSFSDLKRFYDARLRAGPTAQPAAPAGPQLAAPSAPAASPARKAGALEGFVQGLLGDLAFRPDTGLGGEDFTPGRRQPRLPRQPRSLGFPLGSRMAGQALDDLSPLSGISGLNLGGLLAGVLGGGAATAQAKAQPWRRLALQAAGATPPAGAAAGGRAAAGAVDIVEVGKRLQAAGLRIREHPKFGGVGGHSPGSLHYSGRALDVTDWRGDESEASWKPRKAWIAGQFQQILGPHGAEVFGPHNDQKGHATHIHLGLPSGSVPAEAAEQLARIVHQSLEKYPLRWRG